MPTRIVRARTLRAIVGAAIVALVPVAGRADVFYGIGDMTLRVSQSDGPRTWNLPETVLFRVESDFSSSRLLGIDLNFHDTIYEDVSHHFAFSFGIVGTISSPGPVEINIIPDSDIWQSSTYWDSLQTEITVARRVFNSTTYFETRVSTEMSGQGWDLLNFNNYPTNISFDRAVYARSLGSVEYADGKFLYFTVIHQSGQWKPLAPAICNQIACGDYNRNGIIDTSDYVVWRKMLGQSGQSLAPDGNGNGSVEIADYFVWRNRFGQGATGDGAVLSVPEPSARLLLGVAAAGLALPFRRSI